MAKGTLQGRAIKSFPSSKGVPWNTSGASSRGSSTLSSRGGRGSRRVPSAPPRRLENTSFPKPWIRANPSHLWLNQNAFSLTRSSPTAVAWLRRPVTNPATLPAGPLSGVILPGAVLRSAWMGRQTQMDGFRTIGNDHLIGQPADFHRNPVSELETQGGGMGLRFAYGSANAVSTATITRMDEGNESHKGGKVQGRVRQQAAAPICSAKRMPGRERPAHGRDGSGTGASSGKMPDLADWRRQSATPDRRLP